jgi:hypothetical protein
MIGVYVIFHRQSESRNTLGWWNQGYGKCWGRLKEKKARGEYTFKSLTLQPHKIWRGAEHISSCMHINWRGAGVSVFLHHLA